MACYKDCFCHTCDREFHHLGIARHRAKHRDKHENCTIQFSTGQTIKYTFEKKTNAKLDLDGAL